MKLVIFDIDGTLANTDYEKDLCYAEAFQEVTGRSLMGLDFLSCYHVTDSAITDHFFQQLYQRNADAEEVSQLKDAFQRYLKARHATHPHYFEEIPGARDVFHKLLEEDGIHLGIATGAWKMPASFKLEVIGIPSHKVPFVGADDSYSKEDSIKSVINLAKDYYGDHSYESITYVGDRVYDYQVSCKLGLGFIGLDYLGTGALKDANLQQRLLRNYLDCPDFVALLS